MDKPGSSHEPEIVDINNIEEETESDAVPDVENSTSLKRKRSESEDESNEEPAQNYVATNENTRVVATHYNELKEKGLADRFQSKIFYMRNFNNWIKAILINNHLTKIKDTMKHGAPLRVLDMCCGKGGDLLKWEKANITHLICTDIAEISIEQCKTRYESMVKKNEYKKYMKMFSAEFISCDSTLERLRGKYQDPSLRLDLVSCQFAFHYCFESLKQAECMLKNASECLRPGGYFIGTIPDADEIMRRQKIADSKTFGNDVYTISFLTDVEAPPLFGAKYNFQLEGVVNCPEFLVYFPLLEKLAKKFGLELVLKERVVDYYDQHKQTGE